MDPFKKRLQCPRQDSSNYLIWITAVAGVIVLGLFLHSKFGGEKERPKAFAAERTERTESKSAMIAAKIPVQENLDELFAQGNKFLDGEGVPKNIEKALDFYRRAAEREHAPSQATLAYMYGKGLSVAVDYEQAFKWYQKAAEQGDAGAQYNLANCYLGGRGVHKDVNLAKVWLKKAAAQGNKLSQDQLLSIERPYLKTVEKWLLAQYNGGTGLEYWEPQFRIIGSGLIAVQKWELKDCSSLMNNTATVTVRVWSTNRGGSPIVADWSIDLRIVDSQWMIWGLTNMSGQ